MKTNINTQKNNEEKNCNFLNKNIIEYFEEQVKKSPDAIAVVTKDRSVTYGELDKKANVIANKLVKSGVKANDIVGIIISRSVEMIIGIFAVMKAGAAYLPMAVDYPQNRIEFIISDSNMKFILGCSYLKSILNNKVEYIDLDDADTYIGNENKPDIYIDPCSLAYVIYTSGSTGNPKGVMIEHRSLSNRIMWMQKEYPINKEDRILQKTVYTFDVSLWEIFWWSAQGASVFLLEPQKEHSPKSIVGAIRKYRVSVLHFVPSVFNIFLDYVSIKECASELSHIKYIFTSGEILKKTYVDSFYLTFNDTNIKLINLYGPTEATVDVTHFDCIDYKNYNTVPIGKGIDNIEIFILDENDDVITDDTIGELVIGGIGVARGYLNRDDLNKEKFFYNEKICSQKMYRSGDLARWYDDGNIEFLGRKDLQIKLRGLRIEIEEIEYNLMREKNIKEAIVNLVEDNMENQYLCAYIVSDTEIEKKELIDSLKLDIPEYMVPQLYVRLDEIPIKSNGKADRSKLPNPFKRD